MVAINIAICDFNFDFILWYAIPEKIRRKGMHAPGTNRFCSIDAAFAATLFQSMCRSISKQSGNSPSQLLRSIHGDGLCSTHRPRQFARHRHFPAGDEQKNSTLRAFASSLRAAPCPRPMKNGTGGFMPISPQMAQSLYVHEDFGVELRV